MSTFEEDHQHSQEELDSAHEVSKVQDLEQEKVSQVQDLEEEETARCEPEVSLQRTAEREQKLGKTYMQDRIANKPDFELKAQAEQPQPIQTMVYEDSQGASMKTVIIVGLMMLASFFMWSAMSSSSDPVEPANLYSSKKISQVKPLEPQPEQAKQLFSQDPFAMTKSAFEKTGPSMRTGIWTKISSIFSSQIFSNIMTVSFVLIMSGLLYYLLYENRDPMPPKVPEVHVKQPVIEEPINKSLDEPKDIEKNEDELRGTGQKVSNSYLNIFLWYMGIIILALVIFGLVIIVLLVLFALFFIYVMVPHKN